MNYVSIVLSSNELAVIKEAIHGIQLRGVDAPLVAHILSKVYKGIDDLNAMSEDGSKFESDVPDVKVSKVKK